MIARAQDLVHPAILHVRFPPVRLPSEMKCSRTLVTAFLVTSFLTWSHHPDIPNPLDPEVLLGVMLTIGHGVDVGRQRPNRRQPLSDDSFGERGWIVTFLLLVSIASDDAFWSMHGGEEDKSPPTLQGW